MKKLISLFIVLLPLALMSQGLSLSSVTLKSMDARNVKASDLVQDNQPALIYFFNETSQDALENLEYLQTIAANGNKCDHMKIIAIYYPSNGNYTDMKPFLSGNSIDLETYIDVNGEFRRSLGMSTNVPALLTINGTAGSERLSGSSSCTAELISLVSLVNSGKSIDNLGDCSALAKEFQSK